MDRDSDISERMPGSQCLRNSQGTFEQQPPMLQLLEDQTQHGGRYIHDAVSSLPTESTELYQEGTNLVALFASTDPSFEDCL